MKNGALVGIPFAIQYLISKGTLPTFVVTFDNVVLPNTYTAVSLSGVTTTHAALPAGLHYVTVRGYNLISDVTINVTFTIDQPIYKPWSKCDQTETITGKVVTYTVGMTSGTSVNVTWDFGDKSAPVSYVMPLGSPWPSATAVQAQSHSFAVGGLYTAHVYISNNYNYTVFTHPIIVYGKIANITMTTTGPVPFVYGAGVANIIFISLTPPYNVNLTFNYGDGVVSSVLVFNIANVYPHTYLAEGVYTIKANISNKMSWGLLMCTVAVATPIVNMQLILVRANAAVGVPFTIGVAMDTGGGVIFYYDFGDATASSTLVLKRTGRSGNVLRIIDV